jgi:DNA-directed RNA polymerase subunit beta'
MRTFHTGGVAGGDITQGLPRVEELFEARKPKGMAIISEISGKVEIRDNKKKNEIVVTNDETGESKAYLKPYGTETKKRSDGTHLADGDYVEAGDQLTEGSVNPHDLLKIKGVNAVQDYLLQEVQRVYRLQGVEISDKHIEVLVRQMLKKVRVDDPGDTGMLPGTMIDNLELDAVNERMKESGLKEASSRQILLGITKASLATESFLSAASFQETTKVLTDAAIKGKVDHLVGPMENVIIGKLIPAGTGMKRYRSVKLDTSAVDADYIGQHMETEDYAEALYTEEQPEEEVLPDPAADAEDSSAQEAFPEEDLTEVLTPAGEDE